MKLFEIPPLGEHYTKQWAKEEMEFQKNQSSCSPRPAKRLKLAERVSPEVVELVNKVNYVVYVTICGKLNCLYLNFLTDLIGMTVVVIHHYYKDLQLHLLKKHQFH